MLDISKTMFSHNGEYITKGEREKMGIKSIALVASTLFLSSTSNAALIERLGGLAYYDDVADLTWLADANNAATSGYAGADATGTMTWANANAWAAQLTVGGVSGWRLPDTIDVGNDGITYADGKFYTGVDAGYNMTTHSELSNLYYNVLGNLAEFDTSGNRFQAGWGLQNTGPFSNVQSRNYWSATEYAPKTYDAWLFGMGNGSQLGNSQFFPMHGWAVQSGDVSMVPVPAAVWLFGSGLLGLVGLARRKA